MTLTPSPLLPPLPPRYPRNSVQAEAPRGLSHLHRVLQSPEELGAVAQPVDDVEDEEGERHRHQEEPVSRDVVWTTELLSWLF